jgi:purine-binding chemotaxis protein CheW
MKSSIADRSAPAAAGETASEGSAFVTFVVDGQAFGVPVLTVQDILVPERIAPVPLAPSAVCGSLNLRGKIVTVVDVRSRLGLPAYAGELRQMGVTVEHQGESYALLVDRVGDVVTLAADRYEERPSTLDPLWRDLARGLYRRDDDLIVVLDVARLLTLN